jgi:hypothetical protein
MPQSYCEGRGRALRSLAREPQVQKPQQKTCDDQRHPDLEVGRRKHLRQSKLLSPRISVFSKITSWKKYPSPTIAERHRRAGRVLRCHSMTSSARESNDSGMLRTSSLAVLRLITNRNLVGCWTGRSEGLAPFKIIST